MKLGSNLAFSVLTLTALIMALTPFAEAYERYHNPATPGQGYCAECHDGYVGGPTSPLHARHTGGTDPVTTNCLLCHTTSSSDNPLTMWSALNGGNGFGCAGCHGRDYGEFIASNIGGFPTAGKPKSSGYGLRKHHKNAGETVCLSCHPDVNQSDIKPEYVNPSNYSRSDVSFGGMPLYAADHEDSANDGDTFGLDNDGDLKWDASDSDCSLTVDMHVVPVTGGTVNMDLHAGTGNAQRNYILLGSVTGTSPGFPLPGGIVTLPINWDIFTDLEMTLLNSILFHNFLGKLNGQGGANAQLNVPALPSTGVGLVFYFAYCMNSPFDYASNPTEVVVVP